MSELTIVHSRPGPEERDGIIFGTRAMHMQRLTALLARHFYMYRRNFPRVMEVFYWPLLDLTIWGFITLYLAKGQMQLPHFVTFLLGALILWDVLFRSQQAITLTFLEDVWAKNLINLFGSPLKPSEYLAAAIIISILKAVAVSVVMGLCAMIFFSYNILILGVWLIPLLANLVVTGWVIGIFTTSLIMRFGQEAAYLAWGIVFLFQPISCVFYPVEALPGWLQPIAWLNPASHVFEGTRAVLIKATPPWLDLSYAIALNVILIAGSLLWFFHTFAQCQEKGTLVRVGE